MYAEEPGEKISEYQSSDSGSEAGAGGSGRQVCGYELYSIDYLNEYLEEIRQKCKFKKWFFGHYHDNRNVNAEEILIWEQIIRIV